MGKRRMFQDNEGHWFVQDDFDDEVDTRNEGNTPAAFAAAVRGDVVNAAAASTPGGIEAQEARGTRASAAEETLPIDMGKSEEILLKMGFSNFKKEDNLFRRCTFPTGWTKIPHPKDSRTVVILDAQGVARGEYFYKAAYYDRKADGHFYRRYQADQLRPASKQYQFEGICVIDRRVPFAERGEDWTGRKILFQKEGVYEDCEKLFEEATAWLVERHPDWADVLAYWNE